MSAINQLSLISKDTLTAGLRKVNRHPAHDGGKFTSAEVIFNGQAVGMFVEDDWGGPNRFKAIEGKEAEFDNFKVWAASFGTYKSMGHEFEHDAETIIYELLRRHNLRKKVNKVAKKNIVFAKPEDEGTYRTISFENIGQKAAYIKHINSVYPEATIVEQDPIHFMDIVIPIKTLDNE